MGCWVRWFKIGRCCFNYCTGHPEIVGKTMGSYCKWLLPFPFVDSSIDETWPKLWRSTHPTNLIEAFNRRGAVPRWISIRSTSTSLRAEVPWGFFGKLKQFWKANFQLENGMFHSWVLMFFLHFSGIDWVGDECQLGKWCISQKTQLTAHTTIVVYCICCYGPFFVWNLSSAPKQKDVDEYSQYSCQLLEELLTLVWLQKLQLPKKYQQHPQQQQQQVLRLFLLFSGHGRFEATVWLCLSEVQGWAAGTWLSVMDVMLGGGEVSGCFVDGVKTLIFRLLLAEFLLKRLNPVIGSV